MLKIYFEAETEHDYHSPLMVAQALISEVSLTIDDLDDISQHLAVYVRRADREGWRDRESRD